jgi:hypothetical protein
MPRESPTTPDEMRRRVAELLDELDDPTLQWLHYEVLHPEEEAEKKGAEFVPLDRSVVIAELAKIATERADAHLAEGLRDGASVYAYIVTHCRKN